MKMDLPVFSEVGSSVDKSWDRMALVQNSGERRMGWLGRHEDEDDPVLSPSTPAALLPYCRDLQEWPERWMGEEKRIRSAQVEDS